MPNSISFQYLEPGSDAPRAGYEITDLDFTLPDGAPIPRTGEFFQLIEREKTETYEVLAVTHRIFALQDRPDGYHSVLTVTKVVDREKAILSWVRE